ncbi:MAG: histidine phosphatase family protein [Chloroflexota bacterium]|nr:histidine phosphatase family protein [Chloroflexota bacterium]
MNKLILVLLRHGETDHNSGMRLTGWGDPELNERGYEQARAAADKILETYKVEQIYVSSLRRARQTAEALAQATGLTPLVKEDLKEQNFGEMEGLPLTQIKDYYPELFHAWRLDDPEFSWPDGETRRFFHTRVARVLWEIIQTEAGVHQTVAVVGHGAALAGFVTEIMTGSPYLWREWLLENCEHYVVSVNYPADSLPTRNNVTFNLDYIGNRLDLLAEVKVKLEE